MARRIQVLLSLLLLILASAADATASSVSIEHSPDPAAEKPIALTVRGVSDADQRLWAYTSNEETSSCYATAYNQGHASADLSGGSDGVAIEAGEFERSYSVTYPSSGNRAVCAFLGPNSYTTDASGTKVIAVRPTAATVSISTPADAVETVEHQVTVSGYSEAARRLWVFASPPDSTGCRTSAEYELTSAAAADYSGEPVDGDYSVTFSMRKPEGGWRICAHVAKAYSDARDGRATADYTVRRATGRLRLSLDPASYYPRQPVAFSVAGSLEIPGRLLVAAVDGTCPASSAAMFDGLSGQRTLHEIALAPGDFSLSLAWDKSAQSGRPTCAWLQAAPGLDVYPSNKTYARESLVGTLRDIEPAETAWPGSFVPHEQDLRPEFAWRPHPFATDHVEIYNTDTREARRLNGDGEELRSDTDLPAAAVLGADGFLRQKLPFSLLPGHYEWIIVRDGGALSGPVTSTGGTFIVGGPHMERVSVSARHAPGSSSRRPGRSVLTVRAVQDARVDMRVRRGRQTLRREFRLQRSGMAKLPIEWSCKHPSRRYTYRLTIVDEYGKSLRRSGSFRAVSRKRCQTLRRAELREARRRSAAERERRRRAEARRRRAYLRLLEQWKADCRGLGGIPVLQSYGWVCKHPRGGSIFIPGWQYGPPVP